MMNIVVNQVLYLSVTQIMTDSHDIKIVAAYHMSDTNTGIRFIEFTLKPLKNRCEVQVIYIPCQDDHIDHYERHQGYRVFECSLISRDTYQIRDQRHLYFMTFTIEKNGTVTFTNPIDVRLFLRDTLRIISCSVPATAFWIPSNQSMNLWNHMEVCGCFLNPPKLIRDPKTDDYMRRFHLGSSCFLDSPLQPGSNNNRIYLVTKDHKQIQVL